jgi:hypothetical protein
MGIDALVDQLKTIPDWRRGRAVQHPLWLMLLMTLLGVMSGYSSLRGLADFMQRHQQEVAEYFGLNKAKLPSYSTLREMTESVDGTAVAGIFQAWAKASTPVEVGQAVAIDGKALGSTVRDIPDERSLLLASTWQSMAKPWVAQCETVVALGRILSWS